MQGLEVVKMLLNCIEAEFIPVYLYYLNLLNAQALVPQTCH